MATTLLLRRGLREEKRRRWELTCCEKDCVGDERRRPENWAQFVEIIDAIVKSQSESQIIISAALPLALAQPLCVCVWLVERVGWRVTFWCSVGDFFTPFFFFPIVWSKFVKMNPCGIHAILWSVVFTREDGLLNVEVTTTIPNWTENLGSVRFNFQM